MKYIWYVSFKFNTEIIKQQSTNEHIDLTTKMHSVGFNGDYNRGFVSINSMEEFELRDLIEQIKQDFPYVSECTYRIWSFSKAINKEEKCAVDSNQNLSHSNSCSQCKQETQTKSPALQEMIANAKKMRQENKKWQRRQKMHNDQDGYALE